MDDGTLDAEAAQPEAAPAASPEPHLFVAIECARLLGQSTRHRLGLGGVATLGRGTDRSWERGGDYRASRLVLRIPDRRMSSSHATLEGALGKWKIVDAGSKNGVRVNGVRTSEQTLQHGDVIELGHTLFLYKETPPAGPDDFDAAQTLPPARGLATLSPQLAESFGKLDRLARANVPILILGETGTGKEVVARAIHELSGARGKFVGVNCGAIPATLVEGELFGSTKGAYSGSVGDRPGLIREADGGTLFLDEIGDLPLPAQAAFLRVLQERAVRPVGGTESFPVDIRVSSATNQPIDELVRQGDFRSDLFARIGGFRIQLPPLRQRREDLGLLVGALLERIAPARAASLSLATEAARRLVLYSFPLNVRELENWLTAAVALAEDGVIRLEHLPEPLALEDTQLASSTPSKGGDNGGGPKPLNEEQARHKKELVELLREHGGNVSAVARATGKARNQIQRWIKRYAIHAADYR